MELMIDTEKSGLLRAAPLPMQNLSVLARQKFLGALLTELFTSLTGKNMEKYFFGSSEWSVGEYPETRPRTLLRQYIN